MTILQGVAEENVVELRCPRDYRHPDGTCSPGKLFAELRLAGERPTFVQPDNLIVMACGDCKRWYRKQGREVFRVLHYYNMLGELIRDEIVDQPGHDDQGLPQA